MHPPYHRYTAEQFLWDESFRDWVVSPTPASEQFWQTWLEEHPEKEAIVRQAARLVRAVQPAEPLLADEEREEAIAQILSARGDTIRPLRRHRFPPWTAAAAVVILLLGAGFWFFRPGVVTPPPTVAFREFTNTHETARLIRLEDGTTLVLQPGSRLRWRNGADKREVFLSGEAFFEVARDTTHPFWVYTARSATRVVGTSFIVREYQSEKRASVQVKTGKVAVYTRRSGSLSAETILTPNQQLVMGPSATNVEKSLPVPEVLREEAPAAEVFNDLSRYYGIAIHYDQETMQQCPVVVPRQATMHLLEKIEAICLAINASYELRDGQLFISGKGCQ